MGWRQGQHLHLLAMARVARVVDFLGNPFWKIPYGYVHGQRTSQECELLNELRRVRMRMGGPFGLPPWVQSKSQQAWLPCKNHVGVWLTAESIGKHMSRVSKYPLDWETVWKPNMLSACWHRYFKHSAGTSCFKQLCFISGNKTLYY